MMVLEHQTQMHNSITRANYQTHRALAYDLMMAKLEGQNQQEIAQGKYVSKLTQRRIQRAGDQLLQVMLFAGEARLPNAVQGTSDFVKAFTQTAQRDRQKRSLRDLDLTRRLFKYPCSFLIHNRAFDQLPSELRDYVYQRLWNILTDQDADINFAHLSRSDRQAIIEILIDTKKNLPDYWQRPTP